MVFVFGVDIPLVEMIFVLTLILVLLFGLIIYLLINQIKLNKLLKKVIANENVELKELKELHEEEKDELRLLRIVRTELDKIVHGKEYGRKFAYMTKPTAARRETEEEKIRRMTESFWSEIVKLSAGEIRKKLKKAKKAVK